MAAGAFSSRSSPLQIWASIIIDPARAVGGRHFLPLILGRARGGPLPTYLLRRAGRERMTVQVIAGKLSK